MNKEKTLAIIGSGDLGKQIAHFAIKDDHYKTVVFFDDFNRDKTIYDYRILGDTNAVIKSYKANAFDELIIAIGYKHLELRASLFNRFQDVIPFGKIIHSSCWIDDTSKIEDGTVIYPNCCIDANVVIGNNCIVNLSTSIAHDTKIGNHCFISPDVAIAGFVKVQDKCVLGINSTIIDNIALTSKTQLGGGTVLINDTLIQGLYVGNPGRFIR